MTGTTPGGINGRAKIWVAATTGVFAVAVAVVTHAVSCAQVDIKKLEVDHIIRMSYLDRAINPDYTPEDRQRVLRLIKASEEGGVRAWAEDELERLQASVDAREQLRAQISLAEETYYEQQEQYLAAMERLRASEAANETLQDAVSSAQRETEQAQASIERLTRGYERAGSSREPPSLSRPHPTGTNGTDCRSFHQMLGERGLPFRGTCTNAAPGFIWEVRTRLGNMGEGATTRGSHPLCNQQYGDRPAYTAYWGDGDLLSPADAPYTVQASTNTKAADCANRPAVCGRFELRCRSQANTLRRLLEEADADGL